MTTRVVFNQKGGVGKTTIVCNLAAIAASRGLRTLVVDLDTQGNATQYLMGSAPVKPDRTIADFFESTLSFSLNPAPFITYATNTPFENLDIVAADPHLDELAVKLEAKQKIYKLRDALRKLRGYDAVFIDTPPALNFYSRAALIACERVLIPFDCDEFARQALYTLLDNITEIRADHNDGLVIEGIVVNQFQARSKLPARIIEELKAEGRPVLDTLLSSSIKVKESHELSRPLIYLDRSHRVTQEYIALYDALHAAH
ncbi:chromosome partitioning protein [Fontimonas thermophila]|uniref:Chromosome partitioning protein n=1 Tax=Fontimonas thermophila TaxID=1076937 RepID=A0A1I2HSN4_9GAMM|nr:ParA family protein [Fontimonas thermophila]SFF32330.1 chromosome partitioning protein [Fontimonas thermophila]